jgi:predicted FMN-binding regulatory protein PaiB
MYIPQRFKVTDQATIDEFIELNGFASLVTGDSSFPMATHIPIELGVNKQGKRFCTATCPKLIHNGKPLPKTQMGL